MEVAEDEFVVLGEEVVYEEEEDAEVGVERVEGAGFVWGGAHGVGVRLDVCILRPTVFFGVRFDVVHWLVL